MRINNVQFQRYQINSPRISFTSDAISSDEVASIYAISKKALVEANNNIDDTMQIKKNILREIKELEKEFKIARKNNFEDEYYPNGSLKRKYFYSKWLFRENLRAIDYSQSGAVKQVILAEDGRVVSIARNRLPDEITDTYECLKDGTFTKISLGKRQVQNNAAYIDTLYDKIYEFDNRGILKKASVGVRENTHCTVVDKVYLYNRYLQLTKHSVEELFDRQLNTYYSKYIFSYKDKKPAMLETGVEEQIDSLGRIDIKTREVERTVRYIN